MTVRRQLRDGTCETSSGRAPAVRRPHASKSPSSGLTVADPFYLRLIETATAAAAEMTCLQTLSCEGDGAGGTACQVQVLAAASSAIFSQKD